MSLRERLSDECGKHLIYASRGVEPALSVHNALMQACDWIDEEEAERDAMLSLLDSPQPGTRVEGEGFRYVVVGFGKGKLLIFGEKSEFRDNRESVNFETALPLLKALVKAGGAKVLPPQIVQGGEA